MITHHRYSILIVDDTPGNIQVVATVLAPLEYDLSFAVNGSDALELITSESFDLILLDVMMPGMSGFEVAARLQQNPASRSIPIIFLTARTDEESISRGFASGGVDYITKPFNHTELLARLHHHLEFHRQQRLIENHNQQLQAEIKQRRQAEQERTTAYQQLADFVANIEDIACVRNLDGTLRQVNNAYHRLTGITQRQLRERPSSWLEVIHPEDRTPLRQLFSEHPTGSPWLETEYRLRGGDGRWYRMHARMVGARERDGTLNAYHCVERDVTEQRRSEEQRYHRVHSQLAATIEALPDAMLLFDQQFRLEAWHNPLPQLLLCPQECLGSTPEELFAPALAASLYQALEAAGRDRHHLGTLCALATEQGDCWLELAVATHRDPFSEELRYVVLVRDVSDRIESQRRLRQAAVVFDHSSDAIMVTDAKHRLLAVNRTFCEITGYHEEEVLGKTPRLLSSGRHDEAFYRSLWEEVACTGSWRGEFWNRRKSGEGFPVAASIIAVVDQQRRTTEYYIGILSDLTEMKRSEQRLRFLANHDVLTGLPNRSLLSDRCEQAIRHHSRRGNLGALLVIHCNRFKAINDSLGHPVGDQLLQQVGQRIGETLRHHDTLARLDGDTFAVLLEGITQGWDGAEVANQILSALNQPFRIGEYSLTPGGMIGISLFPQDSEQFDTLLHQASAALGHARSEGGEGYRFYSREMTDLALERVVLESDFHLALKEQQFVPFYQPQIDLQSGALIAAEVLIRWQHPRLGLLTPDRFIPFAEESGLVVPMTEWLIDTIAAQLNRWQSEGISPQRLAINLSPLMFRDHNPSDTILELLTRHQIAPQQIELEITEGLILADAEGAMVTFSQLREHGFLLAIDDFGTGYSSLSYLNQLPIDKLKIDRSFVKGIPGDPSGEAITRTIIQLAHGLGLRVIAEGVEKEAQEQFLRDLGCHEGQGWLYGKALPADAFAALWREWREAAQSPDLHTSDLNPLEMRKK